METENAIYFYAETGKYGYMSNLYKIRFVDADGHTFCCLDQYLMYHKAKRFDPDNRELLDAILKETSATKIKELGIQVRSYNDIVWREIRRDIMLDGLRLKFGQHGGLQFALLSTMGKNLYDSSNTDTCGKNLLGSSLMAIRMELYDSNVQEVFARYQID